MACCWILARPTELRADPFDPDGGFRRCDTIPMQPYFRVKGKYPESSGSLARRADAAVSAQGTFLSADGYACFQFLIDDHGKFQLLRQFETDERYERTALPNKLTTALEQFLRGLDQWKPGSFQNAATCYQGYMNFKIENGHVTQVSP